MKKQSRNQEVKFLAGTFVFALALLGFSSKGILEPLEAGHSPSGNRRPAGTATGPQSAGGAAETDAGSGQLATLDWNCAESKETPKLKGTHVRLKSKYCDKTESPSVKIINQKNGYTAAVFLAAKGFSTDFIDLDDGENQLLIEWKNPKGQKVQREFKVFREPAQNPSLEGVQDGRTH